MKTKRIVGGFIAFTGIAHAQVWTASGGNLFSSPVGTCKIGIGVSSPTNKLHVNTTTEPYGIYSKNGGQNTASSHFKFGCTATPIKINS